MTLPAITSADVNKLCFIKVVQNYTLSAGTGITTVLRAWIYDELTNDYGEEVTPSQFQIQHFGETLYAARITAAAVGPTKATVTILAYYKGGARIDPQTAYTAVEQNRRYYRFDTGVDTTTPLGPLRNYESYDFGITSGYYLTNAPVSISKQIHPEKSLFKEWANTKRHFKEDVYTVAGGSWAGASTINIYTPITYYFYVIEQINGSAPVCDSFQPVSYKVTFFKGTITLGQYAPGANLTAVAPVQEYTATFSSPSRSTIGSYDTAEPGAVDTSGCSVHNLCITSVAHGAGFCWGAGNTVTLYGMTQVPSIPALTLVASQPTVALNICKFLYTVDSNDNIASLVFNYTGSNMLIAGATGKFGVIPDGDWV